MITDSYAKMLSEGGMRSVRERELSMYRSGSAPPTVEGSLDAYGGITGGAGDFGGVTEEELRSDPSYIAYYYSNVNLNPRLPPPLRKGGAAAAAAAGGTNAGSIGDKRKAKGTTEEDDDKSLFSMQLGFGGEKNGESDEFAGLGMVQKSIAEMLQDGMNHTISTSRRPASRAFDDVVGPSESQFARLHHGLGASGSQSYASALGASLSRSTTPDPQLIARAPSPRIPSAGGGRINSLDKRILNVPNSSENISSNIGEHADLVTAFSGMGLSVHGMVEDAGNHMKQRSYSNKSESAPFHISACSSAASYLNGPSTPTLSSGGSSPSRFPTVDSPNSMFSPYGLGSYGINPTSPSMLENQLRGSNFSPLFDNIGAGAAMGACGIDPRAMGGGLNLGPNLFAAAAELQNINRLCNNQMVGGSRQMSQMDPMYLQYLRSTEYLAAQLSAGNDPIVNRESLDNSLMDLLELQKAYYEALLASQQSQYGLSCLGQPGGANHGYYGNLAHMLYPGSTLADAALQSSPFGPGSPVRYGERNMHFPSGMRNLSGLMGSTLGESFAATLLDEFKSNKSKCFELSEIESHVVEFSADQYGSRFIQQKLETATLEEKNMVFHEIMPQALSLMTDVFGNYVVQKFFEHGSASQIRELADQLNGHVLTLTLQMYGCRVIQKAIEVVELDQQTKMVTELDGHIMRCVRDQNGNHVIQKCIECIPEDAIQFIVSTFYDQVVTLSTHPYGCRVIQRVLEHCHNPETQSIVMKEILKSICMLAQDQYGNYVVQHVMEHGKPEERTCIINMLKGQIVQMSQQKFASNVVEKCLTFGTPDERQTLVNEMLGSEDENDPLQVMMKDQFANYVVQKVLETCDDQQLELILNRIKVHLNALKKYTYGKHIVARVEKLVAAGERRISILASYSTSA